MRRVLIAAALALNAGPACGQAFFRGLGDLPGGLTLSEALAVSRDGAVVVGTSNSANGYEAFRWSAVTGMVGIGPPVNGDKHSYGLTVSGDGTVVGGVTDVPDGYKGFTWTQQSGMEMLGAVDPSLAGSILYGLSFSGDVVVGVEQPSPRAFVLRLQNGVEHPLDDRTSRGESVSDDGTAVAGSATNDDGHTEAFRWTAQAGPQFLGDLPEGGFESNVREISADGMVVVGQSKSGNGDEAFRWAADTGMVGLGDFADVIKDTSDARGVSADGSVVVGIGDECCNQRAFYWTEETGLLDLKVYLMEAGLDCLSEWTLKSAWGVSADGRTVVGSGMHNGVAEAWIARVPSLEACYADCDHDCAGALDLFDFLCFQNKFNATDPFADCTGDGVFDLFDFLCFVNAFNEGCPQ